MNGGWGISDEIALRRMPLDLTDDKSTLVQVMAWWRQATSHYLSRCWPRSISLNGVTRPQWVNEYISIDNERYVSYLCGCNKLYTPLNSGLIYQGRFKLLYLTPHKFSTLYKNRIFQCIGKIFCVKYQGTLCYSTENIQHLHWNIYSPFISES